MQLKLTIANSNCNCIIVYYVYVHNMLYIMHGTPIENCVCVYISLDMADKIKKQHDGPYIHVNASTSTRIFKTGRRCRCNACGFVPLDPVQLVAELVF